MTPTTRKLVVAIAIACLGLTACGKKEGDAAAAAAAQQMPATTVDVQVITLGDVPLVSSFSGRISASETSEVRPQITGVIEEILFQEGSIVQAGQPLYRINPDNYSSSVAASEASLNQARANVATAKASLLSQQALLEQARADLARLKGLLEIDAISRQAHDQAVTAVKTSQAAVEQAKASLASSEASVKSAEASLAASRRDLNRTIVRAPITGRSGISAFTKGALVSSGQASALVTISRLNPVFVDISQSSADMLKLRQQLASGEANLGSAAVQIVLEDGSIYPSLGRLALANAQVDESTGAITLRAVVDNPDSTLIPGMYVNAKLNQSVVSNATLVPKSAVTLTNTGEAQVYIVNKDKKIEVRKVTTVGTQDGNWVVNSGLNNGDQVVVLGGAKVKPEQQVEVRVLPATDTQAQGQTQGQGQAQAPAQAQGQAQEQAQGQNNAQASTPSQATAQTQAVAPSEQGKNSVLAPKQAPSNQSLSNNAPQVSAPAADQTQPMSAEEAEALSKADSQ